MTDFSGVSQTGYPPLPCEIIVYRALRARSWMDEDNDQIVQPIAYELRTGETGISVIVCDKCPTREQAAVLSNLKKCYGVDSLHVGRLRDLGFDVVQDDENHALIIGLRHPDVDLIGSLEDRDKLLSQSRKQDRPNS